MERTKIAELKVNTLSSIIGKVFRVFETRRANIHILRDETGSIEVIGGSNFAVGDVLCVIGRVREGEGIFQLYATEIRKLGKESAKQIIASIDASIEKNSEALSSKFLIEDRITKVMETQINDAAKRIRRAILTMRPILIRYHADADGICGALALKKGMEKLMRRENFGRELKRQIIRICQSNSAVYATSDALKDINLFSDSETKPFAIFIDCGANEDSKDALSLLKGAGFEILIIDHHPTFFPIEEYTSCFVSPWKYGGESDYSAGFLSGEISKRIENVEVDIFERISLIADKSRLIEENEELCKKGIVLDFLGIHSKFPSPLSFYENVLNDRELFDTIYAQATTKMERVKEGAKHYLKLKELSNGIRVYLVRLDKIVKKGEFPGKGKVCGKIHDELSSDLPTITIGCGGRIIIFRANQKAKESGFDATQLINELKNEITNGIDTGGGHSLAASLRINKGFGEIILEEILKKLEKLGAQSI